MDKHKMLYIIYNHYYPVLPNLQSQVTGVSVALNNYQVKLVTRKLYQNTQLCHNSKWTKLYFHLKYLN